MRKFIQSQRGVTFIELVLVILFMAIFASVAVPAMANSYAHTQLRSAAEQVVSALHYAQSMAVNECGSFGVVVSPTKNEISVVDMRWPDQPIANPLTARPFRLAFGSDRLLQGVRIAGSSFTGPIQFNSLGSPVAGGWIDLKAGDLQIRIQVQAISGRIDMLEP